MSKSGTRVWLLSRQNTRALWRIFPATMNTCSLLPFFLLLVLVHSTSAAKILLVAPSPSVSHQRPFQTLAKALLERGHQVTYFTTDLLKLSHKNYTEIDLSASYNIVKDDSMVPWAYKAPIETLSMIADVGEIWVRQQLGYPAVQDFIRQNHTFDLVVFENLLYHAYYGLFHKVGSPPLVGFVTMTALAPMFHLMGNPMNPAYVPDVWLGLSDHMNFWERMYNTYFYLRLYYMWFCEILPQQESIMREFFGNEPPPVYETFFNYSLLVINNHFSLEYPRPLVPSVVELTGIHVPTNVEQLPKDVQTFLDGAEHGVIYFSLGSNVQSKDLPPGMVNDILEVFRQLPQRVLWKWESDTLPNLPKNVMTRKWLQQPSILAHPKVRLFIMQGGLQSLSEATYYAIPFVVIPFYADQHHNAAKIVQAQIGVRLAFQDFTKDAFQRSIRTVLDDPKYKENMKRLSAVFRDHKADATEQAVWWLEYVIRHQGARHLRSAALDLHWWQLLLLDVIGFVIAVAALSLYVIYVVVRRIVSALTGNKQKVKQKKQ